MATKDEDPRVTHNHLLMLKRPELWPRWPLLCMKRRPFGKQDYEHAAVFDMACDESNRNVGVLFAPVQLCEFHHDQAVIERAVPMTPEEIVRQGWEVD